MSSINLQQSINSLAVSLFHRVQALSSKEPLQNWFDSELKQILRFDSERRSLSSDHARLSALKQLGELVDSVFERGFLNRFGEIPEEFAGYLNPATLLERVKRCNFSFAPLLLLGTSTPKQVHDEISDTAIIVDHLRRSLLQDSAEMPFYDPSRVQEVLRAHDTLTPSVRKWLAVLFASRYQTVNRALRHTDASQILEIASGVTPRGIEYATTNAGGLFIETDLHGLMKQKAKVAEGFIRRKGLCLKSMLHFCGLNAMDLIGTESILEQTDSSTDLAIITEGLLLYFNENELDQFLSNMRQILSQRRSSTWIVDIVTRENIHELFTVNGSVATAVRQVFKATNRNVESTNPFGTEDEAERRLAKFGLRVSSKIMLESSSHELGSAVTRKQVKRICGSRKVWIVKSE